MLIQDPESTSERIAAATKDKDRGNQLFKENRFAAALAAYIEVCFPIP